MTNHLEFRLYLGGELVDSAKLPVPPERGTVKVSEADAGALAILLERFMSGQLPSITDPRDLATHLARRTRQMANEVRDAIAAQIRDKGGDLSVQYHAFRDVLLPDLTESDDYIKFIRFAHDRLERTGYGIIGMITNHSYLSGIIHRGMREIWQMLNPVSPYFFFVKNGEKTELR